MEWVLTIAMLFFAFVLFSAIASMVFKFVLWCFTNSFSILLWCGLFASVVVIFGNQDIISQHIDFSNVTDVIDSLKEYLSIAQLDSATAF